MADVLPHHAHLQPLHPNPLGPNPLPPACSDLNHTNQFITGLALCSLANICSAEMARDLAPEVERLLSSNNSYVRKKVRPHLPACLPAPHPGLASQPVTCPPPLWFGIQAALCSVRIIRKVPELVENFIGPATSLLTDKHHGVLLTGVQLATELCAASPTALEHYRKVLDPHEGRRLGC